MGFFDALKDRATDLAQAGVAQSKRLAEIAKLKTANMGEEDNIKKGYIELGKLYYAEKGAAPEGAYAAACEKITAAKAAIEANNDRIAELKETGDEDETDGEGGGINIELSITKDTPASAEKAPAEEPAQTEGEPAPAEEAPKGEE